ncbi:MAG: 16S rRNA (uracil(1498)-N(3))-methyltransferase [Chitinophagia bacterium]|nr:16S rRNA (uracil(1498)-N(3))-methyltransferase [Chitinophagia bacterium]
MAQLSRFFYEGAITTNDTISLEEETAKHIWQVLRMQPGDDIEIADGKGTVGIATITEADRYECKVKVHKTQFYLRPAYLFHLCVAFTKNNSRNEWLIEKATELGVASITPIAAARSEKVHFRDDRWEKLIISALLQSKQNYRPLLYNVTTYLELLRKFAHIQHRYIAHCIPDTPKISFASCILPKNEVVLLIGPEGDFKPEEVQLADTFSYRAVSLGAGRLRTETAAIAAAAYFNLLNDD